MDHPTQVKLIRRVLEHASARTTDTAPAVARWPVADYVDSSRLEAELAGLKSRPTIIAHVSELSRPGDYLTRTVYGVPLVLAVSQSGTINAFVNMCRHRAARLVQDESGSGLKAFVCPYHAWTYDLDGRLTGVPDREQSFPGLRSEDYGLAGFSVESRHGFVWATLAKDTGPAGDTGGEAKTIADFLGPLDDELRLFGFDQFHLYRRESARWRFNWKMGIEGFFENYHFAVLHRNSTSRIFLHNTNVYDTFGPHLRVVPAKRSMLGLRDRPESEWDIRPHATLLYGIFPATCLFIEKNHLSVLQAMPEAPTSTLVHISHIVAKDGLGYRQFWEKNIESFMSAVREDFDTAEAMTEGLAAGLGPDHVVFGRNEGACIEYRKAIDNMVEMRSTVQPTAKPAGNEPDSRH